MRLRAIIIFAYGIIYFLLTVGCYDKTDLKPSPELDHEKQYICKICDINSHCFMSYPDDCTDQFFKGDNDFISNQCCPGSIKEVK